MAYIVHLTSAHPRDDVRIFLKECRTLANHGHIVKLVVADGLGNECCDGVEIIDVGRASGRVDRMLHVTRKVLKKGLELDADIYHLHDPELIPYGLTLKRYGKKVVFDAHEDVPKQILGKHYLNPLIRHTLSFSFGQLERYACARFDGVITATPYIRDKFLPMNLCTVDINNFPILGELAPEGVWKNKTNEVCYVGNIAEIRGIKELVRAMENAHGQVKLNLVGGFAEAEVETEVKTYPGWNKVNAFGVLGRQGVKDVLGRSIAGLVTLHPIVNYLDALPIKMFEYMSAGIPVIASNFPLWREIVEGNQCGLCVDPLDPKAIGRAIDELIEDPEKAQRMGENGKRAVIERYNWSPEALKLLSFYDRFG